MYLNWQFYLLSLLSVYSARPSLSAAGIDLLDPMVRLDNYGKRVTFNEAYGSHDFTSQEQIEIVEKHNYFRSSTSPSASSMLKLVWESRLASDAKNYIATCYWDHDKALPATEGEALWTGPNTGINRANNGPGAVNAWYNEYRYYDYNANTCQDKKVCGHYFQVVHDQTHKVGCGRHYCQQLNFPNGTTINDYWMIGCRYDKSPYKGVRPFKEGARCSICSEDYRKCEGGTLCTDCNTLDPNCSCELANCGAGKRSDVDCSCSCCGAGRCTSVCKECTQPGWCSSYDSSYCQNGRVKSKCVQTCSSVAPCT